MTHKSIKPLLLILSCAASQLSSLALATEENSLWSYETDSDHAVSSDILLPIGSLILPGLGQWARGQRASGAAYTGIALGGAFYAANASLDFEKDQLKSGNLDERNVAIRKYLLGSQVAQAAGGFSLYHSFRSAVWQRQKFGEYGFLGEGDSPKDILLAPFKFEYLARPTTFIPLAIGGALSMYIASHPDQGYHKRELGNEDPWFAGSFSYNAGTHEEAIFRGWALPLFHEQGLSPGMSNLAQGTIFALAHLGSTPMPLPQFFLGLHLGNVTLKNHWSITESVFIHAWWDVFAFLSSYKIEKNKAVIRTISGDNDRLRRAATLWLPPLQVYF